MARPTAPLLLMMLAAAPALAAPDAVEIPRVTDDRLEITMIGREPDIVTPVGIAVDERGRLFVVESNTHFRPPDYKGAPSDRIKLFEDTDGDGKYEKVSVFAEGLKYAMNAAFSPDGALYVVERSRVLRLDDANGDGRADAPKEILRLETTQTYPHDGLGGILFGRDGWLYIGLAENRGTAYTLRGTDGKGISGEADGRGVFRCRPDGTALETWATGVWNPFAMTFYAGTHLLAIDDDPEVRPPDRLLDMVRGADFGFKFRHGQDAQHPFQSWKGELPGTLPMVGAIGEGATGILAGADLALPPGYADTVLVSSWSDRRIEVHRLRPQGASLRAEMSILVQGGNAFRPVAMAIAPDGSVFFTDWVKRRYEIHGHGRVWRLKAKTPPKQRAATPRPSPARLRLERLFATAPADAQRVLAPALRDADPFVRTAAVTVLTGEAFRPAVLKFAEDRDPRVRLGAALALRRSAAPESRARIAAFLADPSEDVRLVALAWAAEDKLVDKTAADTLHAAVTKAKPTPRVLEAYRAAADLLGITQHPEHAAPDYDDHLSALEAPPRGAGVAEQTEAIWRLAAMGSDDDRVFQRLQTVALDARFARDVRADAAAALAMHGRAAVLLPLLDDRDTRLRIEAVRALRASVGEEPVKNALAAKLASLRGGDPTLKEELRFALGDSKLPAPKRPESRAEWRAAVERGGDPAAGRRVFVNPMSACSRCHRVGYLGAYVAPPLTFIGNERTDRLLEGLLEPSADVVWSARVITTKDGTEHMGMIAKRHPDGALTLTNAAGQRTTIAKKDIASDREADGSLMPDGLQDTMTVAAFRDLWAYLKAQNR